jgi:hypothetical protein
MLIRTKNVLSKAVDNNDTYVHNFFSINLIFYEIIKQKAANAREFVCCVYISEHRPIISKRTSVTIKFPDIS